MNLQLTKRTERLHEITFVEIYIKRFGKNLPYSGVRFELVNFQCFATSSLLITTLFSENTRHSESILQDKAFFIQIFMLLMMFPLKFDRFL